MLKKLLTSAVIVFVGIGFAFPVVGQSLDDVLAKHYEAIGGLEAWTGLESMEMSGTISLAGGMAQGPFQVHQKRPSMTRIEITIQGMNIIQAYDGKMAWQIMPMTGSTEPAEADPGIPTAERVGATEMWNSELAILECRICDSGIQH